MKMKILKKKIRKKFSKQKKKEYKFLKKNIKNNIKEAFALGKRHKKEKNDLLIKNDNK